MKARIVVDMQNDFVDPRGSLYVNGAEVLVRLIEERARTLPLNVITKCWHPTNDPSFKDNGGQWPVHCLRRTWGAEIYPGLALTRETVDLVLHKVGYSAFFTRPDEPTGLHGFLRDNWVDSLEICGVALDYCVRDTALDAVRLGYGVTVPLYMTRAVGDPQPAIETLRAAGVGMQT